MQEGDSFAFGTGSWLLVDEGNTNSTALFEGRFEIGNGDTNVMYPGPSLRQIFGNWTVGRGRFEELDQRFSTLDGRDPCPV